jgi:carboxylesterase
VLSLTMASRVPVRGVVAMSTPFKMPMDMPMPAIKLLSSFVPFLTKSKNPDDGWFDKEAFRQHVAYPKNPVRSGAELKLLFAEMHTALPKISVPVLLIHSRDDDYVIRDSMEKIHTALGSTDKQMLWVEGGGHNITEEPTREMVFKAAADFIKRVASG